MAGTAEVRREAGGLFFSASVGSAIGRRPAGRDGGGEHDVRWNATDKRIEKSADGGATWTTVLEFAEYSV